MSSSIYAKQLRTAADELIAAMDHLKFSRDSVAVLGGVEVMEHWTPESLEKIEAFTRRFARVVDLLIHRVFRSIDFYELQETGTLLDVANRAERRGLVASVDSLREMKDAQSHCPRLHGRTDARVVTLLSERNKPSVAKL